MCECVRLCGCKKEDDRVLRASTDNASAVALAVASGMEVEVKAKVERLSTWEKQILATWIFVKIRSQEKCHQTKCKHQSQTTPLSLSSCWWRRENIKDSSTRAGKREASSCALLGSARFLKAPLLQQNGRTTSLLVCVCGEREGDTKSGTDS